MHNTILQVVCRLDAFSASNSHPSFIGVGAMPEQMSWLRWNSRLLPFFWGQTLVLLTEIRLSIGCPVSCHFYWLWQGKCEAQCRLERDHLTSVARPRDDDRFLHMTGWMSRTPLPFTICRIWPSRWVQSSSWSSLSSKIVGDSMEDTAATPSTHRPSDLRVPTDCQQCVHI